MSKPNGETNIKEAFASVVTPEAVVNAIRQMSAPDRKLIYNLLRRPNRAQVVPQAGPENPLLEEFPEIYDLSDETYQAIAKILAPYLAREIGYLMKKEK